MKFSIALVSAFAAHTSAFAPSAQNARPCTSLSVTSADKAKVASFRDALEKGQYQFVKTPPAKDKADDLKKTLEVIMDFFSKDGDGGVDDSDDDTPYVPPAPPAPAPAKAAAAPAMSSTGIELWSVGYDDAAMLAYKAGGSKGDFASFKTKYLADTSAMVGKKNPYKK